MPLSRPQLSALLAAATRQLGWGLRAVAAEVDRWRAQAARIPDEGMRRDALAALANKRGHADGAAMFWTLPRRRRPALLRMLVRYELLQDFLDSVTEPGASLGPVGGEHLYLALADALDADRPISDYYAQHPGRDDGGYLRSLVDGCREAALQLPGYGAVRHLLAREATRATVLLINHGHDGDVRDERLRTWAAQHLPHQQELAWFETTAAVSGWITTHALLVVAAGEDATTEAAESMHAAYFPWLALALTMLDSYVDQSEDAVAGNHNYLSHYPSVDDGVRRLREAIRRAARAVLALPDGERHGVLLGCMIALYLSKDAARADALGATTRSLVEAGGTLPRALLPVLRTWRVLNRQRSST